MRSASPELIALLASRQFVKADLWTLTLKGGVVVRWSAADKKMIWDGNSYVLGPTIEREQISDKMGLEASTLDVTLGETANSNINGVPLIEFIKNRGLDGANIRLDRAFAPTWKDPVTGAVNRFAGRVTSIDEIGGDSAQLTIHSWAILLNVMIPFEVYQAGCAHTVYDAGCGLNEAAHQVTKTVTSGSTTLQVNAIGTSTDFDQGRITFLTGPNAGISRTIKRSAANVWYLLSPLPAVPVAGNTFKASKGCDLTDGTCDVRFNNKLRFKGTPYVPVPETAV